MDCEERRVDITNDGSGHHHIEGMFGFSEKDSLLEKK
jgi:hypothetical protein